MSMVRIALKRFMDNYFGNYVNPNEIEISRLTDDSFCINGFWPHEETGENVELVLTTAFDDYVEFIQLFEITDDVKESMDKITFETLMNLYQAGKGAISCSIDGVNAPSLAFYKRENGIIAKDELETVHEVSIKLKTPEEFIDYTKRYFDLNTHLSGFATFKNWPWQLQAETGS